MLRRFIIFIHTHRLKWSKVHYWNMQHVLVFYSLYFFVVFACPNIFFLLALFYNFMKELLQASSKNEIFSEACPEVRSDGILRILTERPQWEATGLDERWGRPNERKNLYLRMFEKGIELTKNWHFKRKKELRYCVGSVKLRHTHLKT